MDEPQKIKYRVDNTQAIFLISASLMVDVVQAIFDLVAVGAIINRIITIFVWPIFLTWFYFLGIKFTKGNGKNLGTSVIGMVIELIPGLDLLPGWTVATIRLIALSRREDKGKKPLTKSVGMANKKSKPLVNKNPANKKAFNSQDKSVGSEVKPAVEKEKQQKIEKELEAPQTSGAKTAEQKTSEENLNLSKEQFKKVDNQEESRKKPGNENGRETAEKKTLEPGEISQKDSNKEGGEDTRTERYKRAQNTTKEEDLAEFEELPLEKTPENKTLLTEEEGGENKQEFSMGDMYREPIDITPKKTAIKTNKTKEEDEDLRLAA